MENQKYINARNKLIPEAERFADNLHGKTAGTGSKYAWYYSWNAVFHKKMDRLAFNAGITGGV